MGQLTFIALVLIAGWLGWRAIRQEREKAMARLREAEATPGRRITTLERDPETGVYRPVEHDR